MATSSVHASPEGKRPEALETARDPRTINFIDRIFYFEHQLETDADNDNGKTARQDSACFDSWAMPEHMRR